MPTSFPTRPIELSPFPATPAPAPAPIMAATATTTTTTAMQPGVTPFNGYTQGVAGDVSLFPPYPQSVAKTDMAFPPSRADPTAVITTAATAAMTPTATSFTSNALPDNLIFASKAQQQQQQQQTLLQPSYSEPPPLVSGPSLSTLNYNNNNNNNNNNSNSTDTKDSKDKKPAKKGFATYELVCLCAVLVGVLMLLLFPTSSEPRLPFCDTSELFGNNCQPCPEGAHCTKGVARCARGHSLVDNTLCLNREMKAQYNLVKCVHDQLAQQNYRKMCGEAKTPCLTLGELTSACDSPSNESTREALIAFGKDRGIKRCSSCSDYHYHYHYNYNYNYEYVECYSTDDVSVSYLSMCFMRENIGGVLITAVGVCLFCLFAYFLATTRRDMRKAREMHARAVKLLEEARASARRGGYSNDGFLSTTSLRSAVVPAGKHHKSKAVQAQWKIAVRMLEKDPRVTKTSVFSNGKNVNGFKMKC